MKLNILLSSLAATALAVPAGKLVTHESRDTLAVGYQKVGPIDRSSRIPVRIALQQRNLENAMDLLLKLINSSDPKSPDYGKHYTQKQVVDTFAPADDTIQSVKAWLIASGIPEQSLRLRRNKGWIAFETTAGKLESLLNTKYSMYTHSDHGGKYIGTDSYQLPDSVVDHIDYIFPAVAFQGGPKVQRSSIPRTPVQDNQVLVAGTSSCPGRITPDCLRAMYNFTQGTLSAPSNDLGIFELDYEKWVQSDLDNFWAKYASYVPKGTGPKNGDINNPQYGGHTGEANLDYEMAVPIIYPQGTVGYEVGGRNGESFLSLMDGFLEALDSSYCFDNQDECGTHKPTNVISISWGSDEIEFSPKEINRQCNEWMKLGLQGTSVLISSGDSGVASRERKCLGKKHNVFVPGFLGGCPYITFVGATELPAGSQPGDQETATMHGFSSGGGFSNVNAAPSYQKDALSTYFSQHDPGYPSYNTTNNVIPSSGIYNRAGRGYPDVSANGLNGVIYDQGKEYTTGGTSQSAPIFAALITRINNERTKNGGKAPLGFLNPAFYQNPNIFHDITSGDQHLGGQGSDGRPSACGNKGFSAVAGWDPVTGLGTPNYPQMSKVLGAL